MNTNKNSTNKENSNAIATKENNHTTATMKDAKNHLRSILGKEKRTRTTCCIGGEREGGVIAPFWDTFIHICKAGVMRSNSAKIQKLYLAENHIKRYNKSTRRLQPSGA